MSDFLTAIYRKHLTVKSKIEYVGRVTETHRTKRRPETQRENMVGPQGALEVCSKDHEAYTS